MPQVVHVGGHVQPAFPEPPLLHCLTYASPSALLTLKVVAAGSIGKRPSWFVLEAESVRANVPADGKDSARPAHVLYPLVVDKPVSAHVALERTVPLGADEDVDWMPIVMVVAVTPEDWLLTPTLSESIVSGKASPAGTVKTSAYHVGLLADMAAEK